MTHHRVNLMQINNNLLKLLIAHAHFLSQSFYILRLCRQKLMKRRIQVSDGKRSLTYDTVHCRKVCLLERLNLIKSLFSFLDVSCTYHLSDCLDAILGKKHMLCTAQAYSLCTHVDCILQVGRIIRIGKHHKPSGLIRPAHKPLKVRIFIGIRKLNLSVIDVAARAVKRDIITFSVLLAVYGKCLSLVVYCYLIIIAAAAYTAGSHASGHNRRMTGHAASYRKHAL